MNIRRSLKTLSTAVAVSALFSLAHASDVGHWTTTWTASPQPLWEGNFALPTRVPFHVWNQTVRQIVRISVGGNRARIVLSNEYGSQPLVIGAAHFALSTGEAAIARQTGRKLTFGGAESVTIPPRARIVSDPIDMTLAPLSSVAVSLFLPRATPISTFHWDGLQTAYVVNGNVVNAESLTPDMTLSARLFVTDIMVDTDPGTRTVIAFGDSITDGAASTMDRNSRWPDYLAERLAKNKVAVLNAGISGARVLSDKMGVNALARFDRDVLTHPNVSTVILAMGINDIGWPNSPFAPNEPEIAAETLIAGYKQLIAKARANRIRIVGTTLLPFENSLAGTPLEGHFNANKEVVRQAVNRWIRKSGAFDAMIDFDAVVRDPQRPSRMAARLDSGDHLHPGDAGYKLMADAIDLKTLFGD